MASHLLADCNSHFPVCTLSVYCEKSPMQLKYQSNENAVNNRQGNGDATIASEGASDWLKVHSTTLALMKREHVHLKK